MFQGSFIVQHQTAPFPQFQLHTLLADPVMDVYSSLHCVHFESHMWVIVLVNASNWQNQILFDQILDYARYQQHKNMLGKDATWSYVLWISFWKMFFNIPNEFSTIDLLFLCRPL